MRRGPTVGGTRPSVEDVHQLRLMALLHDLVRERKLKGAAADLGVDPRTLAASLRRGTLSPLMRVTVERRLLADGEAAAMQQRDAMQALAQRVERWIRCLGAGCIGRCPIADEFCPDNPHPAFKGKGKGQRAAFS